MNWGHIKYGVLLGVIGYYAACAPVKFQKEDPRSKCGDYGLSAEQCITTNGGTDKIIDSFTVNGGLVDILFISDNSGSMGKQQVEMAARFSSFINSIQNLDFRIAITTQDISASPNNQAREINGNGELQDGKLIPFPSGAPFLTKEMGLDKANTEFAVTIARDETKLCEAWLSSAEATTLRQTNQPGYQTQFKAKCTSGDDRPIYAANVVVQKNPSSFIRPAAHLAIVLLTDEDNRSFGCDLRTNADSEACASGRNQYSLQTADYNETLINTVTSKFPQKTFSVHAIVVKPGDAGCLAAQNQEMQNILTSREGRTYAELVTATGGELGDICSNNYTHELGAIGSNIVERIQDRKLFCANPTDLVITFNPASQAATYKVQGAVVRFATALEPGVKVSLNYSCEKEVK